jgi:hypothetical protein
MPRNENTRFESIEEAQEYLLLLAEAVLNPSRRSKPRLQVSPSTTRKPDALTVCG